MNKDYGTDLKISLLESQAEVTAKSLECLKAAEGLRISEERTKPLLTWLGVRNVDELMQKAGKEDYLRLGEQLAEARKAKWKDTK